MFPEGCTRRIKIIVSWRVNKRQFYYPFECPENEVVRVHVSWGVHTLPHYSGPRVPSQCSTQRVIPSTQLYIHTPPTYNRYHSVGILTNSLRPNKTQYITFGNAPTKKLSHVIIWSQIWKKSVHEVKNDVHDAFYILLTIFSTVTKNRENQAIRKTRNDHNITHFSKCHLTRKESIVWMLNPN